MPDYKFATKSRTEKPNKIRQNGMIPAIIYGKNFESQKVSLDEIKFNHLFREAGTSNLIDIAVDDNEPLKTLVHDIQKNPVTNEIIHVDFVKVNMKEKIHAEIPLEFIGESNAVINLEGSLITPIDSIEVECLPGDLVSEIKVDISVLDDFEKNIKISDLPIPTGIEVQNDPEETVASVQEPRSEEELAELEEVVEENVEEIEVEHKGEEAQVEGEGETETESETPAENEQPVTESRKEKE